MSAAVVLSPVDQEPVPREAANGVTSPPADTLGHWQLTVDPEVRTLCPPLAADELAGLEQQLIREGCRDALVAWNDLLLDGHNRYHLCQKHGLPFRVERLDFADRAAALRWVYEHQAGRRNLTPEGGQLPAREALPDGAGEPRRRAARPSFKGSK